MARALSLSLMGAPPSNSPPPAAAAGECDCHVT